MEKTRRIELIQRSLGLRHKLKVHESSKLPDSHEELAVMLIAKWELEDELHAIEQMLAQSRHDNVQKKRQEMESSKGPLKKKKKV
ncbi:MAG: hypothetical protein H7222_13900 [Methylotenera sp.]|nr:hypothetical protein [Oligoflexia bacterium]